MNNISVQADKKINSGFKIFEPDVRRLIQLSHEQILKSGSGNSFQQYIIKFENGTVAKTINIEDIFIEDNLGSNKIIMLDILTSNENIATEVANDTITNNSLIRILFNDLASNNNSESNAIRYKISGFSRDWVMVTSSLIEERLTKLQRKRFKIIPHYVMIFVIITLLLFLMSMLTSLDNNNFLLNKITTIESGVKMGKITNTNDLIIAIEKAKLEKATLAVPSKFMIVPIIILALYFLSDLKILPMNKFYPFYNFCWGDYLDEYKKIEKRRRFIIGVIIGTIVLGIAINLLSNFIWERINP